MNCIYCHQHTTNANPNYVNISSVVKCHNCYLTPYYVVWADGISTIAFYRYLHDRTGFNRDKISIFIHPDQNIVTIEFAGKRIKEQPLEWLFPEQIEALFQKLIKLTVFS